MAKLIASLALVVVACQTGCRESVAPQDDDTTEAIDTSKPDVQLVNPYDAANAQSDADADIDADADADTDADSASDVDTNTQADSSEVSNPGLPCEVSAAVDGKINGWDPVLAPAGAGSGPFCHEYSDLGVMKGQFSRMYLRYDEVDGVGRLQVLNDWILRKDTPICSAMYNLFRFIRGGGSELWDIRVYGDDSGKVEVRLNDVLVKEGIQGGYSFGPSPEEAAPHTIFEFSISPVSPGPFVLTGHDPSSGGTYIPGDPVPGCDDPDNANVEEPTIFSGDLSASGGGTVTATTTTKGIVLTWASPAAPVPGEPITLYSSGLPKSAKVVATVNNNGVAPWIVLSQAEGKLVVVPGIYPVGATASVRVTDGFGVFSNPIVLKWSLPAAPEDCKTAPAGIACDDGDPATIADRCSPNHKCAGMPPPSCPQQNCKIGSFDSIKGCSYAIGPDGAGCDDGEVCTSGDTCTSGACSGKVVLCPDDGDPCAKSMCSFGIGCVASPTSGGACEDGSICTSKSQCVNGACKGIDDLDCDDGKLCTNDSCDSKAGCAHNPNTLACDDNEVCTDNDACKQGSCSGTVKSCDDGDPCTIDSCASGVGCQHVKDNTGSCG